MMGIMVEDRMRMSCSNRRAVINLSGEEIRCMMLLKDHRPGRGMVSFDEGRQLGIMKNEQRGAMMDECNDTRRRLDDISGH